VLLVTGPVGGSLRGKHLDFTPRVREALHLAAAAELHAMIDLSDGLATDTAKLCVESRCGAVLWAKAIPISDDARQLGDARSPLEHALGDGEDFELVFAVSAADGERLVREQPVGGVTLTAIGEVVPEGLWLEEDGARRPLAALGWEHELR
jgi:thiamine-monophosphate kinase